MPHDGMIMTDPMAANPEHYPILVRMLLQTVNTLSHEERADLLKKIADSGYVMTNRHTFGGHNEAIVGILKGVNLLNDEMRAEAVKAIEAMPEKVSRFGGGTPCAAE